MHPIEVTISNGIEDDLFLIMILNTLCTLMLLGHVFDKHIFQDIDTSGLHSVALPAKNIKVINSFYKGMHDMQRCLRF